MNSKKKRLGYVEFFERAILKLRDTSKSRGIHSVYSNFNNAFREYFGEDPVKITQELAAEGKIEIRPVKGGVMIYLLGEAPKRKSVRGKEVLSKILDEPTETEMALLDKVLEQVAPKGAQKFPLDFSEEGDEEMLEIGLPGTILKLEQNSKNIVISPRRSFRYEAKNPLQAKYIVYAAQKGQKSLRIPKDNRTVFKLVVDYESYCKKIREQAYALFLEYTNDEDTAEALVKELEKKLDLRYKKR